MPEQKVILVCLERKQAWELGPYETDTVKWLEDIHKNHPKHQDCIVLVMR